MMMDAKVSSLGYGYLDVHMFILSNPLSLPLESGSDFRRQIPTHVDDRSTAMGHTERISKEV